VKQAERWRKMAVNGFEKGMRVRVTEDKLGSFFFGAIGTVVQSAVTAKFLPIATEDEDCIGLDVMVKLDNRTTYGRKFWFNSSELTVIEGMNDGSVSEER
jgi:hypothetical protein